VARVLVRVFFVHRKGHEVRAIGAEIGAKFLEVASRSHSVIPLQRGIQAEKPRLFGILLLERTSHDPHNRAYATNRLSARGHSHFDYAKAAQFHRRDLLDHIGCDRARAVSLTPPRGDAA
jgi:hypothetical protein